MLPGGANFLESLALSRLVTVLGWMGRDYCLGSVIRAMD